MRAPFAGNTLFSELCTDKTSSVFQVEHQEWVLNFNIRLPGLIRAQWYELAHKLNQVVLEECADLVKWRWMASKQFPVKSVYEQLAKCDDGPSFKKIWKTRIPEKIKVFSWLAEQNAILTKDNLIRKKWQGSPNCYMCGEPESIDHLFFSCPVAKVTWGVIALCFHQNTRPSSYAQFWSWIRAALPGGDHMWMFGLATVMWATWKICNRICLDKIPLNNVFEVIFSAVAFMRYWAGMHSEDTQRMISMGVNLMVNTAMKLMRRRGDASVPLTIREVESEDDEMEN